jgi:uncharacterized membrane protein YfcA
VISFPDAALLFGAGVLAGVVGTAGGITSLISYPALLAVGLPALAASVTNIVALVACWPGSALTSRPELAGRGSWLRRWALVVVAGALVGSGLLLSTPPGAFSDIVPYLLVFAAATLLLEPQLSAWQERHLLSGKRLLLPCGLFLASVYNGYFGAGSGVIVLVLVMLTVERHMAKANALKNMLLGLATLVSAVILAALGHVEWSAAGALALGAFAGSTIGPLVARRIPGGTLRWFVALTGLALAVRLWVAPL